MLLKYYLEQGVSKAELSRRFGVNRRTIHHWVKTGQLDRDLSAGAGRDAFEQAAAEAALEPGDVAGERRLGDVGAFRCRADPSRLGDGEEPDEIGSFLEHGVIPRCRGGRPHVLSYYMWGAGGGI